MPTTRSLVTVAVCLVNLLIGCAYLAPLRDRPVWDLPGLYFAGRLARSGQLAQLYNRAAYEPLIAEVGREDPRVVRQSIYFNRPAWEAPLFLPLAFFTFTGASRVAILVNMALLAAAVWLIPRWFPSPRRTRPWLFIFPPFLYTIAFGQDTLLLALLMGYGVCLARQGRDRMAGVVLALATFKPHVLFLLPLPMIAAARWKLLAAFAGTAAGLLALSVALVGPEGIQNWIRELGTPQTDAMPQNMTNLRALGIHLGAPALIVGAAIAVLAFAAILVRRQFEESASAALLMSLLCSPHTYVQDYSVMAIASFLAFPVLLQYAVLLPWIYFLPVLGLGSALSPWVPFNLICLIGLAAAPRTGRILAVQRENVVLRSGDRLEKRSPAGA